MINLNLKLDTLNNQNEDLWKCFIRFINNSKSVTTFIDADCEYSEYMNENNFLYKNKNHRSMIDYEVSYLNDKTLTTDYRRCLYLIDENNVSSLNNSKNSNSFNIASLHTPDELSIDKNINLFILLFYGDLDVNIFFKKEYLIISDNCSPLTNALSKSIATKISESNISIEENELYGTNENKKFIIFDGTKSYLLHSLLNSKCKYEISNINYNLYISPTRLIFNFNIKLFYLLIKGISKKNNEIREIIKDFSSICENYEENSFYSFNEQINNHFQIYIRQITKIDNHLKKYFKNYKFKTEYILISKILEYHKNTSFYKRNSKILFDNIIKEIILSKEDINLNFNILHMLYIKNPIILVELLNFYIIKHENSKNNQLINNHFIWYIYCLFQMNLLSETKESTLFIKTYDNNLNSLISNNNSLNVKDKRESKILLIIHYCRLVFGNSFFKYEKYNNSLLENVFSEIKTDPLFYRLNLLVNLLSNKSIEITNFDSRMYGGLTSVRNLQYQLLYTKLNSCDYTLSKNQFDFILKFKIDNSFDNIFCLCTIIISETENINLTDVHLNLNDNPWFTGNIFYNLIFHHLIFSFTKNLRGNELIKNIANRLKFILPDYSLNKKNIGKDYQFLISTLDYTEEYYEFIK